MASSSSTKKFTMKSSDGETFEIEEMVAQSIMNLTDVVDDTGILVPNVTGKVLAKVMEYCKKHVEADGSAEKLFDLNKWDTEFVEVDYNTLFDLIRAANYLNIESLLDLACKAASDMINGMVKGKKPEEIRKIFNIVNDYNPEELEYQKTD